ncbi:prenyltransferase/squalene oxidase repeat-containing protein [Streptomyces sp. NPDC102406]|uniref:prenyltransferase/squalene oxidase repeat-containing protein n=1 Tax=Streptomyces sp. NPDC102406 TaxID=3366171 RepID=UPI0037F77BCE
MKIRRTAALVAATVVIGAVSAQAAVADGASPSPSPKVVLPSGLYGTSDPTYDGVWRQSLALVAQDTVGVKPAEKAVTWLAGQQCENGGFAAFRARPGTACDAKTTLDSNSTAAAVQALVAVGGRKAQVSKGVDWLRKNQNDDGGWGYNPGGASDANSTSVVLGALAAAGEKPADVTSGAGKSGLDALASLALPCSDDRNGGALAYQPDKKGKLAANADATAAGVLGALGTGFAPGKGEAPDAYTCEDGKAPEDLAHNGAVHLQNQLSTHLYLKSQLAGAEDQPDYGNTADAVTAVAAAEGVKYTKDPYAWLEKNAKSWAAQSGPAAYAQLIFAAHATGNDPRDFGGTDLVSALGKTGPAPASAQSDDGREKTDKDDKSDGGGFGTWWIVGVMFIAAVGAGFLISGRKKQQP